MGAEPTSRLRLRGNVLWLSLVSLLNDTASEMIYPLLPLFLVASLGATPALLGVIEGIAESTSSFLKLASGWLSDRVRRRRPLIFAGYAIATVARPLIAISTLPVHVLAIRFGDRIGKGLRSAPRDALLAASVPLTHRGRAFGLHRAADHTGAVIGPLIASALLLFFTDVRTVFALALVPGAVALLILAAGVRDVAAPVVERTETRPHLDGGLIARHRPFAWFLAALLLFTLGNATDAFLLLRAADLGVPAAAIPLLWSVHHVSKAVWSVPGGALADRAGPRAAIVAGWAVYAATYAGFAWADSAAAAWLLFLLYGLFYGLTESAEKALVASLAPAARHGAAFGTYHFTIGIGALPASILFGLIWQRFGAPAAFLTGAALAALAAAVLLATPRPQPSR